MVQECDSKGVRGAEIVSSCWKLVDGCRGRGRVFARYGVDSFRFRSKRASECGGENLARFAGVLRRDGRLQGCDPKGFKRRGGATRRVFIGDLVVDPGWHPNLLIHYSMKFIECQLVTE
jgi:hypothetical protein